VVRVGNVGEAIGTGRTKICSSVLCVVRDVDAWA
jgi:hypothetical protein